MNLRVAVKKAMSTQSALLNDVELCSITPDIRDRLGLNIGHQVRVERKPQSYAIYTVKEILDENETCTMRMGVGARDRLDDFGIFDAVINPLVVSNLCKEEARGESEFIERLIDDGSQDYIAVIAPHGGNIEGVTDAQAIHFAEYLHPANVTSWCCMGYRTVGGAYTRWHISSCSIHERSFPGLQKIINRNFRYAVAFHGWRKDYTLIGGDSPMDLKLQIKERIESAVNGEILIRVAQNGDSFGGYSENNIVNRLGQAGIQLEQSYKARKEYGRAIAEAVAEVFALTGQ